MENFKRALGGDPAITWCSGVGEAVRDVDAIVIPTEWAQFSSLDFEGLKAVVRQNILFDLRNLYHREEVEAAGFEYHGTGVC
jgi:UDPglucose 6-dehydrogenase